MEVIRLGLSCRIDELACRKYRAYLASFRMRAVAVFMDNQFPQCSANASCSVFLAAFFMTKFWSEQIVTLIVICDLRN